MQVVVRLLQGVEVAQEALAGPHCSSFHWTLAEEALNVHTDTHTDTHPHTHSHTHTMIDK